MEDRFLGSLLGLAIGDALGMPVADVPVEETRTRFGEIRGFAARDPGGPSEIPAGEITDETETVLCIVESMTVNNGTVDPENINARLMYLVDGPSRHWMPAQMQAGIREALELDGLVPESNATDGSLAVAVRGVPVGLMHSTGGFVPESLLEDARRVTRLSHGGLAQQQLVLDVALGVVNLLRAEPVASIDLGADLSEVQHERETIADLVATAAGDATFEAILFDAIDTRRPADSAGALAGALAGAARGASMIPQALIDGLGARVYLSLAAPWFYKTAARRAGTLIDLRQV